MAAPYADVVALFEAWEQFGYPEDVGGVYSTDGSAERLTILLIGDTDGSREAEIRSMLEDDSTVTFEAGTYSEVRLQEINAEIADTYMTADSGIYSCGIGWGMDGGFGESGSELRVVVTVDEAGLEEYRTLFSDLYGEAVVVEEGEPPVLTMEEGMELATERPEAPAENDIYGDLAEGPVEAPQQEPSQTPPAPEEVPESDTPEDRSRTAMIIAPIALGAVAVCLVLLRKKKK